MTIRYRIFALFAAIACAAMLSAAATPAQAGCGWSSCSGGYQSGYGYQYAPPQYYQQPSYAQPCCNRGYQQQSCYQHAWYPQQSCYQQPVYAAPQPYYAQPQVYAAPAYEQAYAQPQFVPPGYEQQAYVEPGSVAVETYAEPRARSHRHASYARSGARRTDHVYYPPGHHGRAVYRGPSKPRKKADATPGDRSSVSARDVAPRRVLQQ